MQSTGVIFFWTGNTLYSMNLTVKTETKVTSKGTTTIPEEFRKQVGITTGTVLTWELRDQGVFARPKKGLPNAMQRHIRARAGAWHGKISGVELLKRTRP